MNREGRNPARTAPGRADRPARYTEPYLAHRAVRADHPSRDELRRHLERATASRFTRVYMTERCCLCRWMSPLATSASSVLRTT